MDLVLFKNTKNSARQNTESPTKAFMSWSNMFIEQVKLLEGCPVFPSFCLNLQNAWILAQ